MFGSSGILADDRAMYLLKNYAVVLIFGIFAATDAWKIIVESAERRFPAAVHWATPFCKTAVFVLCTAYLVDATYNPFLYFIF